MTKEDASQPEPDVHETSPSLTTSTEKVIPAEMDETERVIIALLQKLHAYETRNNPALQEFKKSLPHEFPLEVSVGWDHGRKTADILDTVFTDDGSGYLLIDTSRDFEVFWFMIYPKIDNKTKDSLRQQYGNDKYDQMFKTFGGSDIRLMMPRKWNNTLEIFANIGSFAGMEQIWADIIDDIEYPIEVRDRHGFNYKNKAFKNKPAT